MQEEHHWAVRRLEKQGCFDEPLPAPGFYFDLAHDHLQNLTSPLPPNTPLEFPAVLIALTDLLEAWTPELPAEHVVAVQIFDHSQMAEAIHEAVSELPDTRPQTIRQAVVKLGQQILQTSLDLQTSLKTFIPPHETSYQYVKQELLVDYQLEKAGNDSQTGAWTFAKKLLEIDEVNNPAEFINSISEADLRTIRGFLYISDVSLCLFSLLAGTHRQMPDFYRYNPEGFIAAGLYVLTCLETQHPESARLANDNWRWLARVVNGLEMAEGSIFEPNSDITVTAPIMTQFSIMLSWLADEYAARVCDFPARRHWTLEPLGKIHRLLAPIQGRLDEFFSRFGLNPQTTQVELGFKSIVSARLQSLQADRQSYAQILQDLSGTSPARADILHQLFCLATKGSSLKKLQELVLAVQDLLKLRIWIPDKDYNRVVNQITTNTGGVVSFFEAKEHSQETVTRIAGGQSEVDHLKRIRASVTADKFAAYFLHDRAAGDGFGIEYALLPQSLYRKIHRLRHRYVVSRTYGGYLTAKERATLQTITQDGPKVDRHLNFEYPPVPYWGNEMLVTGMNQEDFLAALQVYANEHQLPIFGYIRQTDDPNTWTYHWSYYSRWKYRQMFPAYSLENCKRAFDQIINAASQMVEQEVSSEPLSFSVVLGLNPGYEAKTQPHTIETIRAQLGAGFQVEAVTIVSVLPDQSTPYHQEPAVLITGPVANLGQVKKLAIFLGQHRYCVELPYSTPGSPGGIAYMIETQYCTDPDLELMIKQALKTG